jgi:hypothetical protein
MSSLILDGQTGFVLPVCQTLLYGVVQSQRFDLAIFIISS